MLAEVQLICTHGTLDRIYFVEGKSGIKNGFTTNTENREFVGVSDIGKSSWTNAKTKLMTYVACETGGIDGSASTLSLAYETCITGGTYTAIGFNNVIYYNSAYEWSKNFNMYLASGYGIYSVAVAANSYNYENNSVKNLHLVYSTTSPDLKLGIYDNSSDLQTIIPSYMENNLERKNILKKDSNLLYNFNTDIICEELKRENCDFNKNDYLIEYTTMTVTDANSKIKENVEFVDFKLNVGDFETNSSYTAVIKDNIVKAIYDNTIPIIRNIELESFEKENSNVSKEEAINMANAYLNGNEEYNVYIEEDSIKYFYDISKNKKYIQVPYISEYIDNEGVKLKSADVLKYEI